MLTSVLGYVLRESVRIGDQRYKLTNRFEMPRAVSNNRHCSGKHHGVVPLRPGVSGPRYASRISVPIASSNDD